MESVYEYRALLGCDIASSAGRGDGSGTLHVHGPEGTV